MISSKKNTRYTPFHISYKLRPHLFLLIKLRATNIRKKYLLTGTILPNTILIQQEDFQVF
jgi:hypothetical protein